MVIFNDSEKIKKEVQDFFEKMTFDLEIQSVLQKEEILNINVKTDEPQILIGERGETLFAIQHLLKLILKRKMEIEGIFYVDLDINDYKKKKMAYLKDMARSAAEEVILTKKEKILPSMSAYERRIIHMELAEMTGIKTESIGEEPDRKIMVKPGE
jgi:spoIIIJ-associated protein